MISALRNAPTITPIRISRSRETPLLRRARRKTADAASAAPKNAHSGRGRKESPGSRSLAVMAPTAAPPETPRMYGAARGLRRRGWDGTPGEGTRAAGGGDRPARPFPRPPRRRPLPRVPEAPARGTPARGPPTGRGLPRLRRRRPGAGTRAPCASSPRPLSPACGPGVTLPPRGEHFGHPLQRGHHPGPRPGDQVPVEEDDVSVAEGGDLHPAGHV